MFASKVSELDPVLDAENLKSLSPGGDGYFCNCTGSREMMDDQLRICEAKEDHESGGCSTGDTNFRVYGCYEATGHDGEAFLICETCDGRTPVVQ